jgi:NAD-dependent DNA ligase
LTALGIPLVGGVAAALTAWRYGNLATLMREGHALLGAALSEIHGIGPKIGNSVASYLDDPENRRVLEKLIALGVSAEVSASQVVDGPLRGLSFCVTGTLSAPRDVIHARLQALGGEIHIGQEGQPRSDRRREGGPGKDRKRSKKRRADPRPTELEALLAGGRPPKPAGLA